MWKIIFCSHKILKGMDKNIFYCYIRIDIEKFYEEESIFLWSSKRVGMVEAHNKGEKEAHF